MHLCVFVDVILVSVLCAGRLATGRDAVRDQRAALGAVRVPRHASILAVPAVRHDRYVLYCTVMLSGPLPVFSVTHIPNFRAGNRRADVLLCGQSDILQRSRHGRQSFEWTTGLTRC